MAEVTHAADPAAAPLGGLLVLDLSRALAGPHAAMMLGDLGARVIKVESPAGDDSRHWGPPFVRSDGAPDGPGKDAADRVESTYFLSCNRNKESIVLDLKSGPDAAVLAQLVQRADVLIENFRTGVLDRLGFSPSRLHELNPRLVVLSITGFGHDGPEGGRPGYDQIAQGEAGLMSLTGPASDQPARVGVPIADLLAGMYGAFGVLAALRERDRTGTGGVVRTSLLAAVVGVHAFQGTRYTVAGEVPAAEGNHHPSICPYGAFTCADGMLQIAVGSEQLWRRFAPLVGIAPDDPRFGRNADRVHRRAELIALLDDAFAKAPLAHWLPRLADIGVPAGEVRSLDRVYRWEQTRSQRLLIDATHSSLGTITLPGPPLRFFGVDGAERDLPHGAPPVLDEHAGPIRAWLESS